MDIQDSTTLWRCHESAMVKAFVKEWYIVSEWVKFVKSGQKKSSDSIDVTGQFGDEWRITYKGTEYQLRLHMQLLMSALLKYITVPHHNSNKKIKQKNKTLFRVGISKSQDMSVNIEAKCPIDRICIENETLSYRDLPTIDDPEGKLANDFFLKKLKTRLQNITKTQFIKTSLFYVFTLIDNSMVSKKHKRRVKVKRNMVTGKAMESYIFEHIDEYVEFIKKCKLNDVLYSNAYGPVYRPKPDTELMFTNKNDVYGDVVNTAAKVLFKL